MFLVISGSTMSISVREPVSSEYPSPSVCPKNIIPNSPNIIDGIPDSISVANSIIVTSLPGFAYSLRYTAAPILIGVAIIMEMNMISSVLTILPAIPTVPLSTEVTDVRKDQLTLPAPLYSTYAIIPISNNTENAAHT